MRQRRVKLSKGELERCLASTATTAERIEGLLGLGLQPTELAQAVGVRSPSTLRNWISDGSEPRIETGIALDDLRMTAKVLLDGGLEPDRAARWLTSRDPAWFEDGRPIDFVQTAPMRVIAAAHDAVVEPV